MKTGLMSLSAEDYHADPCETPSLSASIAHILCTQTPRHAWAAHPRLNPDFQRREEEHFDIGKFAHRLLLEGTDDIVIVDYPDWRTNAAKALRDEARAEGRLPLLAKHAEAVRAMIAAAGSQLNALEVDPPLFVDGAAEQTLIWQEGNVMCRARLDWLHDDFGAIDDYKTTTSTAHPERWSRRLFEQGCDIQAAFYLRGLCAALPGEAGPADAEFRLVVQETYPPYALSVISLAPAALELANAKVEYAIGLWQRCLETDTWPGYPTEVCYAELPAWEETRWLEKEAREHA
jgi:hypothetical protein